MVSKVAIVKTTDGCQEAFQRAVDLIGNIDDLNVVNRSVTIKIGIYDPVASPYPTLEATKAVIEHFNHAPRVFLAESGRPRKRIVPHLRLLARPIWDVRWSTAFRLLKTGYTAAGL